MERHGGTQRDLNGTSFPIFTYHFFGECCLIITISYIYLYNSAPLTSSVRHGHPFHHGPARQKAGCADSTECARAWALKCRFGIIVPICAYKGVLEPRFIEKGRPSDFRPLAFQSRDFTFQNFTYESGTALGANQGVYPLGQSFRQTDIGRFHVERRSSHACVVTERGTHSITSRLSGAAYCISPAVCIISGAA